MEFKIIKIKDFKNNFDGFSFYIFNLEEIKKHPFFENLSKEDKEFLLKIIENNKESESNFFVLPLASNPSKKVIILKKKEKWLLRYLQQDIRKIIQLAKDNKIKNLALFLKDFSHPSLDDKKITETLSTNILMADFAFLKYKQTPKSGWPKIEKIFLFTDKISKEIRDGLKEGIIIGKEVNECRDLANTPAGEMTPKKLVDYALSGSKKIKNLKVKILGEKELKKLGCGGILGVSKGSSEKPYLIILEYWGTKKNVQPLVFVGKGVTFDSGGLNIKLRESISEMRLDMSGGAAVINGVQAIAKLGLKVNVIGLVPTVENMPSGSSYHPGDVLKTITGKTIEVINTDAEGRIILADALGYAQRYKPKLIVDIATLTGAAVVALGQRVTALFTNDEKLEQLSRKIGEISGDEVWPLPCWDDYFEDIKGNFGDIANIGKNQWGGAIEGAIFLKQFVGNLPWIHLDIAPTMTTIEEQNLAKGASGVGVRFLVELARNINKYNLN
jgi:leucyl aminopeptidase